MCVGGGVAQSRQPSQDSQRLAGTHPAKVLLSYVLSGWVRTCDGGSRSGPSIPTHSTAEDILESYENPPPIVLPSQGFQVDLEADCLEDSIYQHLLYIRHFLWGLRGQASPDSGPIQPEGIEVGRDWSLRASCGL